MNFRKTKQEAIHLNITPLVDVVFLLLIFFMITTNFSKESQINLNLPEAKNAAMLETSQDRIEVSIDQSGHYSVNAKPLINNQIDTLERAIYQVADTNTDLPFIITGDSKAPHQAVVMAMSLAGQLGFTQLYITTEQVSEQH